MVLHKEQAVTSSSTATSRSSSSSSSVWKESTFQADDAIQTWRKLHNPPMVLTDDEPDPLASLEPKSLRRHRREYWMEPPSTSDSSITRSNKKPPLTRIRIPRIAIPDDDDDEEENEDRQDETVGLYKSSGSNLFFEDSSTFLDSRMRRMRIADEGAPWRSGDLILMQDDHSSSSNSNSNSPLDTQRRRRRSASPSTRKERIIQPRRRTLRSASPNRIPRVDTAPRGGRQNGKPRLPPLSPHALDVLQGLDDGTAAPRSVSALQQQQHNPSWKSLPPRHPTPPRRPQRRDMRKQQPPPPPLVRKLNSNDFHDSIPVTASLPPPFAPPPVHVPLQRSVQPTWRRRNDPANHDKVVAQLPETNQKQSSLSSLPSLQESSVSSFEDQPATNTHVWLSPAQVEEEEGDDNLLLLVMDDEESEEDYDTFGNNSLCSMPEPQNDDPAESSCSKTAVFQQVWEMVVSRNKKPKKPQLVVEWKTTSSTKKNVLAQALQCGDNNEDSKRKENSNILSPWLCTNALQSVKPDKINKKRRRVRFSTPLVTSLQYRPKTLPEDVSELYFDEDELIELEEDRQTTVREHVEIVAAESQVAVAYSSVL